VRTFKHVRSAALLCLSLLACSNQAQIDQVAAQRQRTLDQMAELTRAPLRGFMREDPPNCASTNLQKARGMALVNLSLLRPETHSFDTVFQSGTWLLEVADAARVHGCKNVARGLYDTVIATFVGSGYSALRERARIGIDDLRG
jgi:hypothetical protein